MLTNTPKPAHKRIIGSALKGFFVAEVFAIAVSYGVWFKLNTDRGELSLVNLLSTYSHLLFGFTRYIVNIKKSLVMVTCFDRFSQHMKSSVP